MGTFDLGGGGGKSFPFDKPGDSVTGTILDLEEVQQTSIEGNVPQFWDEAKTQPKMMYRVSLQTKLSNDAEDDGARSVYLRGSRKSESKSSLAAVLDAVRAATGTTQLATGGTLTLTYIGDGVAQARGFNAPKLYSAVYASPSVDLAGPAEPAPAPVVTQAAPPAAAPAPEPAAPANGLKVVTAEAYAALSNAGVDMSPFTVG